MQDTTSKFEDLAHKRIMVHIRSPQVFTHRISARLLCSAASVYTVCVKYKLQCKPERHSTLIASYRVHRDLLLHRDAVCITTAQVANILLVHDQALAPAKCTTSHRFIRSSKRCHSWVPTAEPATQCPSPPFSCYQWCLSYLFQGNR